MAAWTGSSHTFSSALRAWLALLLVLSMFPVIPASAAVPPEFVRLTGPDAVSASIAVSQELFPDGLDAAGPRAVVISAAQSSFAFSAPSVAGALEAPLLLVEGFEGSFEGTLAEIERLGAERAVIAESLWNLPDGFEDALADLLGATNIEVIYGSNRYSSAAGTASYAIEHQGAGFAGTVLLASGENWASVASAAALSVASEAPLLLTSPTVFPESSRGIIEWYDVDRVLVVGSEDEISADVESAVAGITGVTEVIRLAGASAADTPQAVSDYARTNGFAGGSRSHVARVDEENTTALPIVAGVSAGLQGEDIFIGRDPNGLPDGVRSALRGAVDAGTLERLTYVDVSPPDVDSFEESFTWIMDAVDSVAPTTRATGVPDGAVTTTVTVGLDAIDAGSGVAATYYSLNGGPTAQYDAPLEIASLGSYTIVFWSVDHAGNEESPRQVSFEILRSLPPEITEIAGGGRYATAVLASQHAFPDKLDYDGYRTVVIATGRNWPDALGGASLAGVLDAPILLVSPTSVPQSVMDEIERLEAEAAIILGGDVAVGPAVESALAGKLGWDNVARLPGGSRYETAEMIAELVMLLNDDWDRTALVATGAAYADAVAAAPLAAAKGWPLVLAHPRGGLSGSTQITLAPASRVFVLGGDSAVSEMVEGILQAPRAPGAVSRLAGGNRFHTAAVIADHAVEHEGLTWNGVGIATGQDYPDALAGGVLQGKKGSVMLLTRSAALPADAAAALGANRGDIHAVTYFGGELAVSPSVRAAVLQVLE